MLTIRLSRTGKRHKPQYRIVLQEKGRDPWSPAIENLGTYNPHTSPSTIKLKEERITYWLSKGAQPSNTVQNMLINAGLVKAEKKAKSVTISNKRKSKLEAKATEAAEKKAEAKAKAKEVTAKAEEVTEQSSEEVIEEEATNEESRPEEAKPTKDLPEQPSSRAESKDEKPSAEEAK